MQFRLKFIAFEFYENLTFPKNIIHIHKKTVMIAEVKLGVCPKSCEI